MLKFLTILATLAVGAAAQAIDTRLYLAPASAGAIPWTGSGAPFSPSTIGTSLAEGGVGAHVYATDTVGAGALSAPAAGVPVGKPSETFAIWARTENGSASSGDAIRGINVIVGGTGSLDLSMAWVQWRNALGPTASYRWETASDFEGPEVTFIGGIGGRTSAWDFRTDSPDRLDDFDFFDISAGDTGNAALLLGFVRVNSGVGAIQLRLGSNGIHHVEGVRTAFGDGLTYISAGTGAAGRGYGDQALIVPEPAALSALVLLTLLRRTR